MKGVDIFNMSTYEQKQAVRMFIIIFLTAIISILFTIFFMTQGGSKNPGQSSSSNDGSQPSTSQGDISTPPDVSEPPVIEDEDPVDALGNLIEKYGVEEYTYYSANYENGQVPIFVTNRMPDGSICITPSVDYIVVDGGYYVEENAMGAEIKTVCLIIQK